MEMLEKKNHKAQMMQISLSSLSLHVRMCALLRICVGVSIRCAQRTACVCVCVCESTGLCTPAAAGCWSKNTSMICHRVCDKLRYGCVGRNEWQWGRKKWEFSLKVCLCVCEEVCVCGLKNSLVGVARSSSHWPFPPFFPSSHANMARPTPPPPKPPIHFWKVRHI